MSTELFIIEVVCCGLAFVLGLIVGLAFGFDSGRKEAIEELKGKTGPKG